jgi:hypothetical protein
MFKILWRFAQLIDSLIFNWFFRLVYKNYILIFDRSPIDALVDTYIETEYSNCFRYYEKAFLYVLYNNSLTFVFDCDTYSVISRKKDIPNVEYIKLRRILYHHLAKKYGWKVFSTNKSLLEVHQEVVDMIFSYIILRR